MHILKDNQNREWKLKVTLPVLRTLRDDKVCDLLEPKNVYESVPRFLELDVVSQVDAIGEAIRAQHPGFDPYDFAEALDENVILEGVFAFINSLANFYPSQTEIVQTAVAKARSHATTKHEKATELVRDKVASMMDSISKQDGSTSTKQPVMSE